MVMYKLIDLTLEKRFSGVDKWNISKTGKSKYLVQVIAQNKSASGISDTVDKAITIAMEKLKKQPKELSNGK